jgi:phage regulator Rha-like protein
MAPASKRPGKTVPATRPVESLIHVIRGQKVMLDADLATLYEVPTKRLNEAVRRNLKRFPETFMFRLSREESVALRSQNATLDIGRGRYSKYPPLAFTEHGVVMLSSVLNSERAVQMSILVVSAFVRMRELIASNKDIAARMEKLERGHDRAESVIEVLVEDIDRLAREVHGIKALPRPLATKRRIGFGPWDED